MAKTYAGKTLNSIFEFNSFVDNIVFFLLPIFLGLLAFMYFNPSSALTKSYEETVNENRQRRRNFWQSLGINPLGK